jgi:hypothetical protein
VRQAVSNSSLTANFGKLTSSLVQAQPALIGLRCVRISDYHFTTGVEWGGYHEL